MRRRLVLLVALGAAVFVAAAVGGLWLAFGNPGAHEPTRQAYLARVSSVCRRYARQLARIGAPYDVTAYGDVLETVGKVLPLLRQQSAAMQAVQAPAELRPKLDRLFAFDGRSIVELEATVGAARRRDAGGVAKGFVRFSGTRDRVHALAVSIGIHCEAG